MRILHIGDFHFKTKGNNYEQQLMIEKMLENLKGKPKVDLVLFTGDLVNSGSKSSDFDSAHNLLFTKLSAELNIPLTNIIVSPGNHDIRREDAVKAIINYFDEKIISSDLLNEEYQKNTHELKLSFKSSKNFTEYVQKYFSNTEYIEISDLYTIIKYTIEEKSVGVITLNSAWLSCGHRNDNDFLMFPSTALKNAILRIKNSDCKIIMIHHPLSYFKEFNYVELEDLIHKEFDLMFSGHIHREQIATKFSSYNGIFLNTTQATLTFDKGGEIGYSIINYDLDNSGKIVVERGHYLSKENLFIDLEAVYIQIPVGVDKARQNNLRNKITSKFLVELNYANELLLDYDEEKSRNFIELFTNPLLSLNAGADVEGDSQNTVDFETLYLCDKNYLIFGRDKSGKTSLLKKLQLHFLKSFSLLGKIPFYIDYKDLEAKGKEINVIKLFKYYYEISNQETERIISSNKIIFLIDNHKLGSDVDKEIVAFLEANKQIQFIICSEYIASKAYFEEIDHLEYTKLYLKDLTRKEIRLYSEKNNSVSELNKEEVLERISKMLKQLQLPVSYWTISLILLIYKKSQNDYNKNLFAILDLCVDEILQKRQISQSKANLTFDQYKVICSQIAFYLLTEHKDSVYSASAPDLITFINDRIKENERIVGDAKRIFDYLFEVGLLKQRDEMYTFRLNGLFEYFLAYYMHQHPQIKAEILENDSIYLSFRNELEIYSGLNRKDEDFLMKIFEKTKNVFDGLISDYKDLGSFDNVLILKLGKVNDFVEKVKKIKVSTSLSHEVQDIAKDAVDPLGGNSEVHLKNIYDISDLNPEVLERYLEILARVYKNSDGITNTNLIHEIFDYLVEAYISFGFYLIDEFAKFPEADNSLEITNDENGDLKIGKDLLRLLSSFIPILSQILLFDGVGHPNIANIVSKHIEKYQINHKENQYKLFLLYFLLMDLDIKKSKSMIDIVFEQIKLGPLKVSTYFKLNFYLAFKSTNNKELENFLRSKIREAQIRIDVKSLERKSLDITLRKEDENILKLNNGSG